MNNSVLCLCFVVFSIVSGQNKDSLVKPDIVKQKQRKRIYFADSLRLYKKIDLSESVFKPGRGGLYGPEVFFFIDNSTQLIHSYNYITDSMSVFGNGHGEGPGEILAVMDFKIKDDKIFIVDPYRLCVIQYSTDGQFIDEWRPAGTTQPNKIIFCRENITIQKALFGEGYLYHTYDTARKLLRSYGKYIDETRPYNPIYHDSNVLQVSDHAFYHIPLYLGLAGLYEDGRLTMIRTTIDGQKNPGIITSILDDDTQVTKLDWSYHTARENAVNKNFIINKAFDVKKHKFYYDVYSIADFTYMGTLGNIASMRYFYMNEKYLVGVDDFCLYVYHLTDTLE